MQYKVIVSPNAIEDLQNIYNYIAYEKKSIINAELQISRIKEDVIKLDTLPNAFKTYPKEPWCSKGLKYFPIDNYLVFYMVDEDKKQVNVLRIIYGKMNLSKIWK